MQGLCQATSMRRCNKQHSWVAGLSQPCCPGRRSKACANDSRSAPHPLQQLVDALAEAPRVRQVAGPKVGAEGLVDEVGVQVHADGVGRRRGERHGLLQAVEVEAAGQDLRRAAQVVAPSIAVHARLSCAAQATGRELHAGAAGGGCVQAGALRSGGGKGRRGGTRARSASRRTTRLGQRHDMPGRQGRLAGRAAAWAGHVAMAPIGQLLVQATAPLAPRQRL